jgi:hypothetical protein
MGYCFHPNYWPILPKLKTANSALSRFTAQAEAEACIHAPKAASDWGMVAVHVEADSQNLIKALQGPSFDPPEGILYRDMRIFMNLNFFF